MLLVFIIGFFNWPYIGRIIRGQTLSLREREFVDAARSLGARRPYILFTELLPNLVAPILVYSTLLIPTNILFEAALSFLGVGVRPPTATWGGMLRDAVNYYTIPHFMLWPGIAIFSTVLAFNLFGDGLRDALDPRASVGTEKHESPHCSRRGATHDDNQAMEGPRGSGAVARPGPVGLRRRQQQRRTTAGSGEQHRGFQRGIGQGVQPVRQKGRHGHDGQRR